jgi:hypothetical protein
MLGFTLYYKGELTYYESVSKETLSNGIQLFLSMGVIEKHSVDEKGIHFSSISDANFTYRLDCDKTWQRLL